MEDQSGLSELFASLSDQIALLTFSGVGGAFFRAVLAPEKQWGRRIAQGVSGALSAIFLGGVVAHLIVTITGADLLKSYLAAGFLMGVGGEWAVKALQERLLVKK